MRIDNTLNKIRSKQMGAVSCDRDSFNPHPILSNINSWDRIITIDSNVDLPTNWRELNLIDLVDFEPGSTRVPNDFESKGTSYNAWSDISSSDVGATSEEDHQNLAYLTCQFLLQYRISLLLQQAGSIDGTFKVIFL